MRHSISRRRSAALGAAAIAAALGVGVSLGTLSVGTLGIGHASEPVGAVTYVPITPCRLLDTRPATDNVGNRNTPIGGGQTHVVAAHGDNGNCKGIPATSAGLALNVTALNATAPTFLTIWPDGAAQPFTANLNPTPGEPPTPNAVVTGVSANGRFDIFNLAGAVDVVVDVFGYFTAHQHTGADIVDGSLTGTDIQDATISGADIQDDTVTGADIQNNSVTNADTQNEPGLSDNYAFAIKDLTTNVAVAVVSTSIRVPSDGYVDVQVTGQWLNNGAADSALCQLQKGAVAAINTTLPYFILNDRDTASAYTSFSAHRSLPISVADNPQIPTFGQTLQLVCTQTNGSVVPKDVHITALFVPSNYEPASVVIP